MAWHLVKDNPQGSAVQYKEFLIDEEGDILNPPTDVHIGVGSVAYTCESGGLAMEKMWMKCSDGTWSEM